MEAEASTRKRTWTVAKIDTEFVGLTHDSASKRKRGRMHANVLSPSDEIILRVFEFLSFKTLLVCQLVCRRFNRLARDDILWRAAYRNDFQHPTLMDMYSSETSFDNNSMDGSVFSTYDSSRHWQQYYKTNYNWSRGDCVMREIPLPTRKETPSLVRTHHDRIFLAGRTDGVQAWRCKGSMLQLEATELLIGPDKAFSGEVSAIDISCHAVNQHNLKIALASTGGRISTIVYDTIDKRFDELRHYYSIKHGIVALAIWDPYIAVVTETYKLYIFRAELDSRDGYAKSDMEKYQPLAEFQADGIQLPATLALYRRKQELAMTLCYTVPSYLSEWSIGIQEIRTDLEGNSLGIRTTNSIMQHIHRQRLKYSSLAEQNSSSLSRPIKISYNHPYALVAYADNTIEPHLVHSTGDLLILEAGKRFWDHTSGIGGIHVGYNGRAVSVGRSGLDVRLWDLERHFWRVRAEDSERSGILVRPLKRFMPRTKTRDYLPRSGEYSTEEADTVMWIGVGQDRVMVLDHMQEGLSVFRVFDFS